ncbi:AAA ATPase [Pyrobaculum calidifontis JCM 11548]|uniref:AAA ATPase n=1 Tax=Pyrobaculum calidifontis (strain DSM 21063 / JCM 11548 / VA1) TaxID=410359 RepID=A3MW28_PYRCJ|nr:AAA ATPase [Pyrobaculum calidifontis JCM 11548]
MSHVRIPEIPMLIKSLYFAGRPSLLILGPPGIGKSESVRAAAAAVAKELGLPLVEYSDDVYLDVVKNPEVCLLVDLRLTEVEPADIVGVPRPVDGGAVQYFPQAWAKALSKAKCGFLFLDELTNVQRDDVAAVAYKLLLEKKAGFTKFSEGAMVVAAGNDPETSPIARPLPAPLINRVVVLKAEPPTVEEWYQYMAERHGDFDKRTYLYLTLYPEDLLEKAASLETVNNFATPRSWTTLALLLARGVESPDVIYGLLGPAVGAKFKAFISTKVDVEDVLSNPQKFDGLKPDERLILLHEVARAAEHRDVSKFVEFLQGRMEWLILFLRLVKRDVAAKLLSAMPHEVVTRLYKVATIVEKLKK